METGQSVIENVTRETPEALWAVDGVPAEDLAYVWAAAWPYLQRAINHFPDLPTKYTEGELLTDLIARKKQLWVAWSFLDDRVVGAVITEIITDERYPDAQVCSIPLVGGDDWMKWGDSMWNTLKAWAAHNGCTHVMGYGRKGWKRLYGFMEVGKLDTGLPIMVRVLAEKKK